MDVPRSRRPPLPCSTVCCGRASGLFAGGTPLEPMAANSVMMTKSGPPGCRGEDKKLGRAVDLTWILLLAMVGTLLLSLTLLVSFRTQFKRPVESLDRRMDGGRQQRERKGLRGTGSDRSVQGLVAGLDSFGLEDKCASRGHRTTEYKPTPYLIDRLREYEALHRRCAEHAKSFRASETLNQNAAPKECRYVVWIAYSGLGNRLLSLVSAFLYALLTNRILLVDRSTDVDELFCEPFPGTSWLVPPDFPHTWLAGLDERSPQTFGALFNRSAAPTPAFSYVHLTHTYNLNDRKFFCDQGQKYLHPIPWLFVRANNYIVPGLYFLSSFTPQLHKLFPEKEAVFYLLSRYLFHPSDAAWGWIRRFQRAYLANSQKQVGIQIRTFNDTPQSYFQEQLSRCAWENHLLPEVSNKEPDSSSGQGIRDGRGSSSKGVTSILVTSLQPEYYEKIRDIYMSAPTQDGQIVAVHQPSHEGWQKTDTFGHDMKAWADIYLLSLSDVLITSGWSTFGYSAQALAGVRAWILFRSFDRTVPNPPCTPARSIDPCFHTPPLMDCENLGIPRDPSTLLPFVQRCEELPWGIKIVDPVAAAATDV